MPRYKVQHRYRSNDFGPWEAGDQITLDDPQDAEYVNRDSPGTLVEVDQDAEAAKKRERFAQQQAKATKAGGRVTGRL